jgi:hypothetical protein
MRIWIETFLELVGVALVVATITLAAVAFAPEPQHPICTDCR